MCRSKKATDAGEPQRTSQPSRVSPSRKLRLSKPPTPSASHLSPSPHPMSYSSDAWIGNSSSTSKDHWYNSNNTLSSGGIGGSGSRGSAASLASLRESLPESPTVYDISEIRSATNNFLARRHSASSAPCWRCSLRGKDAIVFQRKFHRDTSPVAIRDKLSVICKSHHVTIIKLLGASLSGGYIFLVYEFVPGINLEECLRNPNNPSFTVLSTWMSRIQIATDLANGLDYIHNNTGLRLVHNHIKSGSVIVADPTLNARICHFGTAILCGEAVEAEEIEAGMVKLKRTNSEKFQGSRGYMSPEFQSTGIGTQRSDVFALGVVMLELVSGVEPVKYTYDKVRKEYVKRSVVEGAREAVEEEGRLRRWVDGRLRDSFPVGVVDKLTRLALECVQEEADQRPNMRRVAAKISNLYLQSQGWAEKVQPLSDLPLSYGPR